MDRVTLKRIDVFTRNPFGGNPAGVVLGADSLTSGMMQALASEMKMNLIELAYITKPRIAGADHRIRFFTPKKELEISGHVLLGACYALIEEGLIELAEGMTRAVFETNSGKVAVEIYYRRNYESGGATDDDGEGIIIRSGNNSGGILEKMMMNQPVYSFSESPVPADEIASVLGIDPAEITSTGLPVALASNEIDWLIIPVKSKETIMRMHPDLIKLGMMNKKYRTFSNHIFSLDTYDQDAVTYSRNFSPAMGLWEDPASASGSAGLGGYLLHFGITASDRMIMQQGNEEDNLATIHVEIEKSEGSAPVIKVGGLAVNSIQRSVDMSTMETV